MKSKEFHSTVPGNQFHFLRLHYNIMKLNGEQDACRRVRLVDPASKRSSQTFLINKILGITKKESHSTDYLDNSVCGSSMFSMIVLSLFH